MIKCHQCYSTYLFLYDFEPYLKKFCGAITFADSNNDEAAVFLKLFTLLYEDDTILFSENEEDMQNAVNSTMKFCTENNLQIYVSKTKMIFLQGKIRKFKPIFYGDKIIECVDTFFYLGVVFKYNNSFLNAIKHNVDKARKAVFTLEGTN